MDEFPTMWLLTVTISFAIGAFAVALRVKARSWSHPAVIFALVWFLLTLLPILGVPELVASPSAMAYILAAVIAFGLPVFFIDWKPAIDAALARTNSDFPFSARWLLYLFVMLQVLPVVFMAVNLHLQGFDPIGLIIDPLSIGRDYLGARYSGAVEPNVFSQAGTVLNYVGAPIGGLIVVSRRSISLRALVFVLAFLPSVLNVVLYGDKGTVFLTGAYFYGAIIVARIAIGNIALVTKKTIIAGLLVALVVVPLMAVAMLNRGGGTGAENRTAEVLSTLVSIVTNREAAEGGGSIEEQAPAPEEIEEAAGAGSGLVFYLRSYAFAHLFAFSDWFDHRFRDGGTQDYVDPERPTLGFWTFMAVGKIVLPEYYAEVPPGYFGEYYRAEGVIQSNIYTVFRGLIADFTLIGSLAVLILFGFFSSILYLRILKERFSPIEKAFFVSFMGFAYTSLFISLLIWTSAYAAFVGLAIVLGAVEYGRRRQATETVVQAASAGQAR